MQIYPSCKGRNSSVAVRAIVQTSLSRSHTILKFSAAFEFGRKIRVASLTHRIRKLQRNDV